MTAPQRRPSPYRRAPLASDLARHATPGITEREAGPVLAILIGAGAVGAMLLAFQIGADIAGFVLLALGLVIASVVGFLSGRTD